MTDHYGESSSLTVNSGQQMADIAIVGGGIGGLCTAIGLLNRGFDPVVYEAAEELRPIGSGIGIAPNGMEALARLDVADAVVDHGNTLDRTELQTTDERSFMSVDLRTQSEQLGLSHVMVAIHRADLQAILSDQLPTDVLQLDMDCVSVDPDRPAIRFATGAETTPELVIGADGVGSTVRSSLFPGTEPRYAGEVAYRGLADTTLPPETNHIGIEIWGSEVRFGYFPLDEQVYWFATVVATKSDDVSEVAPAEFAERYQTFPDPVPDLIAMTDDADLIRTPLTDLPRLDHWSRGRATLLGDAAHAMTPNLAQGSAQAMEDAVILTESIADHGITQHALSTYETRRKDRADSIVRQSRIQGRLTQIQRPILEQARNAVFRYTPDPVLRRQTKSMFAVDF